MIPPQVYQLAKELADRDAKGFRPAYIAKNAQIDKEQAVEHLDAMTEAGYLTRQWDAACAECARTLKREPTREEAAEAALADESCFSCGAELSEHTLWVEPVYTPTERLRPEDIKHEAEQRPRVSPLAERRDDVVAPGGDEGLGL